MPDVDKQVWQAKKDEGVVVIGLGTGGLTGNDAAHIGSYAESLGLSFPIYLDVDGTYQKYEHTESIAPFPLDVVVGKDGKVRYVSRDFDIQELLSEVDAALSE